MSSPLVVVLFISSIAKRNAREPATNSKGEKKFMQKDKTRHPQIENYTQNSPK